MRKMARVFSRLETPIWASGGGIIKARNSRKTKLRAVGGKPRLTLPAVGYWNLDFWGKRNFVQPIDRYNREKQGGEAPMNVTVNHGDRIYGAQVNTIESTQLGFHDGIMEGMIHCVSRSNSTGCGGYRLDSGPKGEGTAYGLDWIIQVLHTVGVNKWEDLPGSGVLVLFDKPEASYWGAQSVGLANVDTGKAFIFQEHVGLWKEKEAAR